MNAFWPQMVVNQSVLYFAIILTHFNSALNPLLYAYHLKDFRGALSRLFHCTSQPDSYYRPSIISQQQKRTSEHYNTARRTFEPRIYIDSPIWKRQQQQVEASATELHQKKNDNDSGLNISGTSETLQQINLNDSSENKLKSRPSQLRIFTISGSERNSLTTCEVQQSSSLYAIVKRNHENEGSI